LKSVMLVDILAITRDTVLMAVPVALKRSINELKYRPFYRLFKGNSLPKRKISKKLEKFIAPHQRQSARVAGTLPDCMRLCGIFMMNVPTRKNQYGRVALECNSELFGAFYTEVNSIIFNG